MPELPEVHTTATGLHGLIPKLTIKDVWLDWANMLRTHSLSQSKKILVGVKIKSVTRRGKNILIHCDNGKTIIIHMKMTGHVMYGKYVLENKKWVPVDKKSPLNDPYNRFIHFVIEFTNGHHLAFCDTRKFGRVDIEETNTLYISPRLSHIGPEPLEDAFTYKVFIGQINQKPKSRIKPTLMDQSIIAGIGNIYADETLFCAGIHPESTVGKIPKKQTKLLFDAIKVLLRKGIDFGGDSMSDYRNVHGERGKFQSEHQAYKKTGRACSKKGCTGIIERKVVAGRGTHFCPTHQTLFK